jgi:YfiR/HmsC-like
MDVLEQKTVYRVISKALILSVFLLVALAAAMFAQNTPDATPDSSEYFVKAGFIYNFAKLVEWPASLSQPGRPVMIGVLGNDSFASILEGVVSGKNIDGRPFIVRRLKSKEIKDCSCHILFIASSESARADEIIQMFKNSSVLTVAEAPDFARRGGIINFTPEDNKVRFEVNVDAARQSMLTISSRLLSLAKIVHTSMSVR